MATPGRKMAGGIYTFSTTGALNYTMSMTVTETAPPPGMAPNFAICVDPGLGFERANGNDGMRFRFSFGEIPAIGRIQPMGDAYRLSVQATSGVIPYSIEDRERRAALLSNLGEITRASDGAVKVDNEQSIVIGGESRIKAPLTALTVISEVVALMIRTRPYFETMGDLIPELICALPVRPQ